MLATVAPRRRAQIAPQLPPPSVLPRPRVEAIDIVRGLAIVLMTLDHARVYLLAARIDPTDLDRTTTSLFLTRWVTHFCATAFVFLSGTSAYLSARGRARGVLARSLLKRGLWLVILELTLVHFAWFFSFTYRIVFLQVIWAIGWSMMGLAALVYLSPTAVTTIGITILALHNIVNQLAGSLPAPLHFLWKAVHEPGMLEIVPGHRIVSTYPVLPWLGVMAVGYGLGAVLLRDRVRLRRRALMLGTVLTVSFLSLRGLHLGDPHPWPSGSGSVHTILSFLNCCKYPPSPAFVLMTLGPTLLALGLWARPAGRLGRVLAQFGRVPLFFYLVHLLVVHAVALALAYLRHGASPGWLEYPLFFPAQQLPAGYGFRLPVVYLTWVAVLVPLYFVARWFAGVKQRRGRWWLSYL